MYILQIYDKNDPEIKKKKSIF